MAWLAWPSKGHKATDFLAINYCFTSNSKKCHRQHHRQCHLLCTAGIIQLPEEFECLRSILFEMVPKRYHLMIQKVQRIRYLVSTAVHI